MKKVFIKYNPYKVETEVTVDGKGLADNSRLGERTVVGSHLQEWVEELPDILIDEYNDTDFDVTFHGTLLDFEDLTEVFTSACERGELTAKLNRIPAKETSDKEVLIDEVFRKIQEGPFEDLRTPAILDAFQKARGKEFDICVIATMSSGKSTLINAMLGEKLMPSKQEACTAIITYIKDSLNADRWQAVVYDKEGKNIESRENLTYSDMECFNGDQRVSHIEINGNIPFVSAEDVSLVLIDTPGPNNARDPEHKKVQNNFLEKSSKSVVLYIMEGTFGSDDDNALLKKVAESMKVGGKQSKDRFIFVVNKMDDRKKEDGNTEDTLKRIRAYLEKHGIVNPNLFPAAALPALNIRLIEKSKELVDEDTFDDTGTKVRKFNRNSNGSMHFETYAPLPRSIRENINRQLEEAREQEDANAEALIHTGIPSVEAAIRQYAQKYSKTAKIKALVDTFKGKVEESHVLEETKKKLTENCKEKENIINTINSIQKKIDDGESARKFEEAVTNAVIEAKDKARDAVDDIVQKYDSKLMEQIKLVRGKELDVEEAKKEVDDLKKFAERLELEFKRDLDDIIKDNLVLTASSLLEEYRKKLASMAEEVALGDSEKIPIDPLKLMNGSVESIGNFTVENFTQSKKVEAGKEWIENTSKKWYKPWTWFQEDGYYRTKYKKVEVVYEDELRQRFFQPIQEEIFENGKNTYSHAQEQCDHILHYFEGKFKELNNTLVSKLEQLRGCVDKKKNKEEIIADYSSKLEWLESIQNEVESILEI